MTQLSIKRYQPVSVQHMELDQMEALINNQCLTYDLYTVIYILSLILLFTFCLKCPG